MKVYRLEVLHRRTLRDGTKVGVKRKGAHARLAGQAGHARASGRVLCSIGLKPESHSTVPAVRGSQCASIA
jgi:hypothetical protein